MKFLHLSDLHIGKKVNDFSMLDEQNYVLNQAVNLVDNEKINAILISGDIFDKGIAPIAAINLFEDFLVKLNNLNATVFIISGNHDNIDRLSYNSSLLRKNNVYFAKTFEGNVEKINIGGINVFLLPFLFLGQIKKYYPNVQSYNDAFEALIKNCELNKDEVNILLAHQFVTSKDKLILSDSETNSVGGIDCVSYEVFNDFDYVALGHLHCPQKVGLDKIRYSGSILKYSFSEINQKKTFTIIEIRDKEDIKISFREIKFKHEFKKYRGYIDEFLDEKFYSNINRDDYIMFTLLDESVLDAKKKLNQYYPNIMMLEFDNTFTRNLKDATLLNVSKDKTMIEHFIDFYKAQMGTDIEYDKEKIVKDTINSIKGGM